MPSASPLPPDTEWISPEGVILGDLACIACGYNLRSCGATDQCPECGESVAIAVRERWARDQRKPWVERYGEALLVLASAAIYVAATWLL